MLKGQLREVIHFNNYWDYIQHGGLTSVFNKTHSQNSILISLGSKQEVLKLWRKIHARWYAKLRQ